MNESLKKARYILIQKIFKSNCLGRENKSKPYKNDNYDSHGVGVTCFPPLKTKGIRLEIYHLCQSFVF